MSTIWSYHEKLKDCALSALTGAFVGSGAYRDVYRMRHADHLVLKIEARGMTFSNAHEWSIWQEVQGTKWEKWFAPCVSIDGYGAVLVQHRTMPPTREQWNELKRVPAFLADLKPSNFGMLDGRIVAHDYGNHNFLGLGIENAKLVSSKAIKHGSCELDG